jgi:hypothetical protein
MAKRPDKHDATMEVSSSQLVPDAPKPPFRQPIPPKGGAQNDMSLWAGAVVGGDQFTPAPIQPKSGGGGRWILAVGVALALAGGGYALYRFVLAGDPAPKASQAVDNPIDAMPLIADAAVVIDTPAPDAAPDAALPDAGIEPTIAPKPAVKAPVKKKVVKKKKKKPVKKKPVRRRR